MRIINALAHYWYIWVGVGIIPSGRWALKKIFKLIYPDKKLKKLIYILPKSTGIQIYGSKLSLYVWAINLSFFYNMEIKIKNASIDGDNYELSHTLNGKTEITIRKYSVLEDVRLDGKLSKDEKEYFLREPINSERKYLSIKIEIVVKNWLLGDRTIGEKTLENLEVLMEYPK